MRPPLPVVIEAGTPPVLAGYPGRDRRQDLDDGEAHGPLTGPADGTTTTSFPLSPRRVRPGCAPPRDPPRDPPQPSIGASRPRSPRWRRRPGRAAPPPSVAAGRSPRAPLPRAPRPHRPNPPRLIRSDSCAQDGCSGPLDGELPSVGQSGSSSSSATIADTAPQIPVPCGHPRPDPAGRGA